MFITLLSSYVTPLHSCVLVNKLYITIFSRVYSYVSRVCSYVTRMLLACYSYVLVCTRMLLECTLVVFKSRCPLRTISMKLINNL